MISETSKDRFLEGLTKLTRETGIVVESCGCCHSPFLSPESESHHPNFEELEWDKDGGYSVKPFQG